MKVIERKSTEIGVWRPRFEPFNVSHSLLLSGLPLPHLGPMALLIIKLFLSAFQAPFLPDVVQILTEDESWSLSLRSYKCWFGGAVPSTHDHLFTFYTSSGSYLWPFLCLVGLVFLKARKVIPVLWCELSFYFKAHPAENWHLIWFKWK